MSRRAFLIGLLFSLFIAGSAHFNDAVVNQTRLAGTLLPVIVFASIVVLTLFVIPWRIGFGLRSMQPREIAVIAMMALAVCSWAGPSFNRYFTSMMLMPSQWYPTKPSWQAAEAMSYVPGGSALLGEGHLQNIPQLATLLLSAKETTVTTPAQALGNHLWQQWSEGQRDLIRKIAQAQRITPQDRRALVKQFNAVLSQPSFAAQLINDPVFASMVSVSAPLAPLYPEESHIMIARAMLVQSFPEHVLPPPRGQGVLLLGGRSQPGVTDWAIQGVAPHASADARPWEIPWSAWWPSIRLWAGLAVLFGLASLCMLLIVYPQWSDRELLPFPIARFTEDLIARQPGQRWPEVACSRLFWLGIGLMVLLHLVNGIKAWYPGFLLSIPLKFDFTALHVLFPNMARAETSQGLFQPIFVPSVIAFAFFLTREVSFSVGVALPLWVVFSSVLMSQGVTLQGRLTDTGQLNLSLAGACLGIVIISLYAGRRHYWDVTRGALGATVAAGMPRYCIWAARLLVLLIASSVLWLTQAGLDWTLALPLVLLILADYLAIARVNAETGAFVIQPRWLSVAVLTVLLGIESIGPTAYLVMAVACVLMQLDLRSVVSGMFINALRLGDRGGQVPMPRIGLVLPTIFVMGGAVALFMLLTLQHQHGLSYKDRWVHEYVSPMPLDLMTTHLSDLSATGRLESSMQISGLNRWWQMQPMGDALLWLGLGLGLVLVCALARLRLPWWPLHPVAFVFWGTWPVVAFGWSFLAGWALKASVVRLLGSRGCHQIKPLLVGVIAGELLMSLGWMIVGLIYYFFTGVSPPMYYVIDG